MMRQTLIFIGILFIIYSCKKENSEQKQIIDFNNVKISEIIYPSISYQINYENEKIISIECKKAIEIVENNTYKTIHDTLLDRIIFYHSNYFFDSAVRIKDFYREEYYVGKTGKYTDTANIQFIRNQNGLIIQKNGDFDDDDITNSKCNRFYLYDIKNRLIIKTKETLPFHEFSRDSIIYDGNNNIVQYYVGKLSENFYNYDNSANVFNSINWKLKYPFFYKEYQLSNNNPLEYDQLGHLGIITRIKKGYEYDQQGRVVLIDGMIQIKY